MIILTIRTDKPEAELGVYDDQKQLRYEKWQADRQLADTINEQISEMLDLSSIKLSDIEGIICFEGPGSFTGLRIGMSVANALAYGLNVPIVARGTDEWISIGIKDIVAGQNDKIVLPKYGSEPNVTKPKH